MQKSPLIDLYTEAFAEDGESDETEVRFSFGDSPKGMFSVTVGDHTVHISREVISDLWLIGGTLRSEEDE